MFCDWLLRTRRSKPHRTVKYRLNGGFKTSNRCTQTSRLHEANRCANIMVKTSRVIITNLHVPNVWHSCISESYIRHALLIHKLCALSELWSLSYFCVKFQYICIVVQMNVLWVFYNGCSPIEAQWCLCTYEHQTRPDGGTVHWSHLRRAAFRSMRFNRFRMYLLYISFVCLFF